MGSELRYIGNCLESFTMIAYRVRYVVRFTVKFLTGPSPQTRLPLHVSKRSLDFLDPCSKEWDGNGMGVGKESMASNHYIYIKVCLATEE